MTNKRIYYYIGYIGCHGRIVHNMDNTELHKMELILWHQDRERCQEEIDKKCEAINAQYNETLKVMMERVDKLERDSYKERYEKLEKVMEKYTRELSAVCKERDRYKQEVERLTRLTLDNDDYMDKLVDEDDKINYIP